MATISAMKNTWRLIDAPCDHVRTTTLAPPGSTPHGAVLMWAPPARMTTSALARFAAAGLGAAPMLTVDAAQVGAEVRT
nr:hypothetical protein [Kibdelosporangium sp. MJ126-NF4]